MTDLPTHSTAAADSLTDILLYDQNELEKAEIARLEIHVKQEKEENSKNVDPTIDFKCENCDMQEIVHYFGEKPAFAWGITFLEDTFVMRDPFQVPVYPRNKPQAENFIAIGAKCSNCQNMVCKDADCSFFYTCTFCLKCAEAKIHTFPKEVQLKLSRQLSAAH